MEDTPEGCVTYSKQFTVSEEILSFPWKQDPKEEHDHFLSPYHATCFTFICKTCNLWRHVILFDRFSKSLANPQARILSRRNYESVRSSRCTKGGNRIRPCLVTLAEIMSHQTWPNPLSPQITLSGRVKRTSQCHWLPLHSCGDIKRHYTLCCRWRKLHLPRGSARKAASHNGGWGLDLKSPCTRFPFSG